MLGKMCTTPGAGFRILIRPTSNYGGKSMAANKVNIVFHAGLDAYHFRKAREEFSEKDHLNAIADQLYAAGKYPTYSAAMAAATGVYDYSVALEEGHLIHRAARHSLEGKEHREAPGELKA